ncbi:MAG: putative sulfate exporter family transporter, partial [Pseudomonadota bacterium]
HWIDDAERIGLIMGAAIHDTAQVTAAAALYEQGWSGTGTLDAATVTKLLRNSLMLLVIPGLIWVAQRNTETGSTRVPFPLFILGFIALCGVRTLGDMVFGEDQAIWNGVIQLAGKLSVFAFAMAMAANALTIRYADLRVPGWRPAAAALVSAMLILALAIAFT